MLEVHYNAKVKAPSNNLIDQCYRLARADANRPLQWFFFGDG